MAAPPIPLDVCEVNMFQDITVSGKNQVRCQLLSLAFVVGGEDGIPEAGQALLNPVTVLPPQAHLLLTNTSPHFPACACPFLHT